MINYDKVNPKENHNFLVWCCYTREKSIMSGLIAKYTPYGDEFNITQYKNHLLYYEMHPEYTISHPYSTTINYKYDKPF